MFLYCSILSRFALSTILLVCIGVTVDAYEGDLYQTRPGRSLAPVRTNEEALLVTHVKKSISNAKKMTSKLKDPEIFKIDGMSTPKVRHFLNNICSLPNCRYLEIGVWKGSTWVAALYQNHENILEATAIDNWSQFGNPTAEFLHNCDKFLCLNQYKFLDADSFKVDPLTLFNTPVNIYFYDGCHLQESQRKAFTYYNAILDDVFIAIIDDWNSEVHRIGTYQAFDELKYEILFEESLPSGENQFWNGQYVAVIRHMNLSH